jgi:hypothetical protein
MELVWASGVLWRKSWKINLGTEQGRAMRNEDEKMDRLAGFMWDRGSYPWDVVL